MSRVVATPNASMGAPSGGLTPGVARSLGSDGSDGDRKATSGVSPFRSFSPENRWLFALLLLPVFALAEQPSSPPFGLAECRRVERYAGDVAEAAASLGATAAVVHNDGRLHSLQRIGDRLAVLDRSILDLERAVAGLEATLVPSEE